MYNDNPRDVTHTDIRHTTGGAIDTDYYHRRARIERAVFLRAVISCIAHCGWRAWGCIEAKMQGRATRQALSVLSARELKDLGIARSDLGTLGDGTYFTDSTRHARSRERLRKYA
ncbi:MAG: DUF1127 domain-containing protein [Sulfuricaulis sp.]|nr:DUF1127 domain-containing protein [Sulfuricaulis sp.]